MNRIEQPPPTCFISEMPTEVTTNFFKFLSVRDLLASSRVCINWNAIINAKENDKRFWKPQLEKLIHSLQKIPNIKNLFNFIENVDEYPPKTIFKDILKEIQKKKVVSIIKTSFESRVLNSLNSLKAGISFHLVGLLNLEILMMELQALLKTQGSKDFFLSAAKTQFLAHKLFSQEFNFLKQNDAAYPIYINTMQFIQAGSLEMALEEFLKVPRHRNETTVCMHSFLELAMQTNDIDSVLRLGAWFAEKEKFSANCLEKLCRNLSHSDLLPDHLIFVSRLLQFVVDRYPQFLSPSLIPVLFKTKLT